MYNISGFGLKITLIASNTFPVGLLITNFPDDTDALSFPDIVIADGAVGTNGDLITWSKGNSIAAVISVIPDSPSDLQLAALLLANRTGANKISARDTFQMAVIQGNNNIGTFLNGVIISGQPFNGVASTGRMKSKSYNFIFENYAAV
jgi:hypothetical protein